MEDSEKNSQTDGSARNAASIVRFIGVLAFFGVMIGLVAINLNWQARLERLEADRRALETGLPDQVFPYALRLQSPSECALKRQYRDMGLRANSVGCGFETSQGNRRSVIVSRTDWTLEAYKKSRTLVGDLPQAFAYYAMWFDHQKSQHSYWKRKFLHERRQLPPQDLPKGFSVCITSLTKHVHRDDFLPNPYHEPWPEGVPTENARVETKRSYYCTVWIPENEWIINVSLVQLEWHSLGKLSKDFETAAESLLGALEVEPVS